MLFVIPLVCIAAVAFARTVAVPVKDKVSENYSIAEIAPDNPQSKSDTVSIAVAGRQKKTAAAGKGNPVVVKLNSGDVGEVLFVVDGRETNGIDDLDPENIESITVLKDKSAVERYGEKAKNGAVLVTTKGAGMKILTIAGDSAPRVVYSGRVTYDDKADVALWIVDGREVAQEEGKAVNPDDIDHMTIYKGDEAVTRYGERARNGVIEIRTKRVATDHSKSQAGSGVDKKMPQAR